MATAQPIGNFDAVVAVQDVALFVHLDTDLHTAFADGCPPQALRIPPPEAVVGVGTSRGRREGSTSRCRYGWLASPNVGLTCVPKPRRQPEKPPRNLTRTLQRTSVGDQLALR